MYAYYMSFIGVVGQLVFFAQGVKIFQTKSAKDVSILAFVFGLISVTSWFIYGLVIKDRPLVISNFVAIVGAIFVLAGIYFYG
jgi:MtN3 and saliva related transmembrane protein